MDVPLYDVYLTGKLADGVGADAAALRLSALFKSSTEQMAGMLNGKPQLLKRGVDKNTALKYREALQKAGVEVAFKAQTVVVEPARPQTVAAKSPPVAAVPATAPAAEGFDLAPAGSDLLRPHERRPDVAAAVAIDHLSLAPVGPFPVAATSAATPAPDIAHLSVAAAGTELLSAEEREQPPVAAPDISELTIAAVGATLETLRDERPALHPDISQLSLAPAGTELLSPEQRAKIPVPAPDTDHIKLA